MTENAIILLTPDTAIQQAKVKRCSTCKIVKPATLEFFYRHKYTRDGLGSRCRDCARLACDKYNKTHREERRIAAKLYRENNREACNARTKLWFENNPEYRQNWRKQHPGYDASVARKYAALNPGYGRKWARLNKGKVNIRVHRHKSNKLSLPCTFEEKDWLAALTYFDNCCAVCGRPQGLWHTLAMDHWIPITAPNCPGTVPTNIVPLCQGNGGCNNSKSNKSPEEWLEKRFGKRKAKKILSSIKQYFESIGGKS